MTADQINNGLIEIIREKIPPGTNLARVLMDLLCIGKEAVYRRLRGEVPFTLAEAAKVSGRLGISLDKLVGTGKEGNALFDLNITRHDDPVDTYVSLLDSYIGLYNSITYPVGAEMGMAASLIPQFFTMRYDTLAKFRFAKWMYQNQNHIANLDDIVLPDRLLNRQADYIESISRIGFTYYIWDAMLFASLVNDINYFLSIGMLGPANITRLKEELLAMIEEMLYIASHGALRNGNRVELYISNINFEATYGYVRSETRSFSMLRAFTLNSMTSYDEGVLRNLKEWIHSLKKFSILISQSGEMQRIQFFARQKESVATL